MRMGRGGVSPRSQNSTRLVFTELVSEACNELGHQPSPRATGYVVDLLDSRVRSATASSSQPAQPETLAEAMVEAMVEEGASRWVRLRALGDRALFEAGFFAERVERTIVGVDYYADMGQAAYARLSSGLAPAAPAHSSRGPEGGPDAPDVFWELARRFRDFVALLAQVGDRARGERSVDLLQLYDRYQARGAERDRVRLIRHGLVPAARGGNERPQ